MERERSATLKEFAEKHRRLIRDADDLVRRLTIEFEIELGLGSAIVPLVETLEIAPPQRPPGERGPSDGEAHAWRLPGNAGPLRDRFGGSDNATGNKALAALVLAGEHESHIALGNMLAAIHGLLRGERKRLRLGIVNRRFDRKRHVSPPSRRLCYY